MNPQFYVGLFLLVLLLGLELFMPRLTRPDLWFSVTVAPGFAHSPEGRRALGRFRGHLLVHGAIALALLVLLRHGPLALAAAISYLLLGTFEAFFRGRSLTLPHASTPSPSRGASLASREPMPVRALFAVPFALLAATAAWLAVQFPGLPSRLPIRFDLGGRPTDFAKKNVGVVFGPLLISAAVLVLLVVLARATWRTRRITVEGPRAAAEQRFRRGTVWILLAASLFEAAVSAMVAISAAGRLRNPVWPISIGTGVFVVAVFVWAVKLGQGGARNAPPPEGAVGDRTPDARWVAGLLYVNRADPAFLVEKRFGVGYTLNFGNPLAWFFLALLAAVPLVAILVAR